MVWFLWSPWSHHSIDNLVVPPVVEEGEDQVVLDCPFTFTEEGEQEEEEQLELKWYFNDSPAPFYQGRQGGGTSVNLH